MAARKSKAAEEAPPLEPPFYVATQDIMYGVPESGAMPVAAFRKGDQVHVDLVRSNGWEEQVTFPDGFLPAESADEGAADPEQPVETADETSSAPADATADLGAEGVTDASTRDAS